MQEVENILKKYPKQESSLIQVLQDINRLYNYLPEEDLKMVARELHVPLAKVYGVATFYKAFSLTPRGKKIVRVCTGTACHIRGSTQIVDEMSRIMGIKANQTSADLKYTLETVNCLGACAMAPVVVVNEKYTGNVKPANAKAILGEEQHAI